jgi:hypothetical protein
LKNKKNNKEKDTMSKITIREFFQQNYIDTKKITQKFIDKYKGKVTGRKPLNVKEVCVGDLTFEHNGRTPKAIDVMNYISEEAKKLKICDKIEELY